MPDSQTSQPTILIKKPDGTSVRVTLDEFKKMRGGAISASATASQMQSVEEESGQEETQIKTKIETNENTQTKTEIPAQGWSASGGKNKIEIGLESPSVLHSQSYSNLKSQPGSHLNVSPPISTISLNTPHDLATTTPVTDIFIDEARAKSAWTPEDHRSPLEVDLSEIDALKKQGIEHKTAEVKMEHSASIASQISKELLPRFNALVLSFKKGVRSDAQFIEYVLRDTAHGGLGFLHEQEARMLLEEVQKKTKVIHKSISQSQVRNAPSLNTLRPLPESASSIDIDLALPTYTPKQTEHTTVPSPSVVHDMVQPTTQQTTGPEDEIAHFSLRDFRRLSKDPRVASEMLYEKFDGWKKDSFMLYMKTLLAWKRSPLYTQYIALTLKALGGHTSVKTILNTEQQQGGMNMQEYLELVALHGRLVV